ncbi:MAG: T9SS type A sorting domain-containing protein [Bacteroidota bacterium]|nr:T9SS type A sorting domain-containing protein [Bacteroidota bacterium]
MDFKKIYCLVLLLISLTSKSAVYTATACPATWGTSPYPFWNGSTQLTSANITAGDVLVIPLGCSVSISGNITMAVNITLQINGALVFPTSGDKLNLTAASVIIASNTGSLVGVSNSNQIRIGSGGPEWSGPGALLGPFVISNGFLPVEFVAFTGDLEQKVVNLYWKTLTEVNNDYFDIEKSSDGINFEKIASIQSMAPGGKSFVALEYRYIDKDLKHPVYYYRLKQVDLNGDIERTNSISVKVYAAEFSIFPNPNSGVFSIDVPSVNLHEELSVKIYSAIGQLVHESVEYVKNHNITGSRVDVTPSQLLPKGIYLSTISFKGEVHQLKLVVQ